MTVCIKVSASTSLSLVSLCFLAVAFAASASRCLFWLSKEQHPETNASRPYCQNRGFAQSTGCFWGIKECGWCPSFTKPNRFARGAANASLMRCRSTMLQPPLRCPQSKCHGVLFLPPSSRGMSGRDGWLACWRCTVSPLAIHGAGHCTAVAKVVQLVLWQFQQLHEQQLGNHAVPAWLSVQIPAADQWQRPPRSTFLGHCPDQFLSWHESAPVWSDGVAGSLRTGDSCIWAVILKRDRLSMFRNAPSGCLDAWPGDCRSFLDWALPALAFVPGLR